MCYWCRMTKTQAQIFDLFQTLGPDERREVVESLSRSALQELQYDRLTGEQRLQLDEGIAQARRGEVTPAEVVFERLAKRFNFSLR